MRDLGWMAAALLALVSGCTTSGETGVPLRVVAVYDMAAVASQNGEDDARFNWQADALVTESCGPERAPSGLGRPEAELIALRETPMLAVLIEHLPGAGGTAPSLAAPLRADQLRLYVDTGHGDESDPERYTFLQPAVMPMRVDITPQLSTVMPLLGQTIFFQTTVQLCTEHKLGRAWTGAADERLLDEAFLRSPGVSPGEAFFRGQGRPVAAQLGPMRWSLDLYSRELPRWLQEVWGEWPGEVRGSINLVEADIWGARAPRPPRDTVTVASDAPGRPLEMVPFRAGAGELCAPSGLAEWLSPVRNACLVADTAPELEMSIELSESERTPGATRLRATVRGMPDAAEEVIIDRDVQDDARADDIVARLPRYLPRFRSPVRPDRAYTLLLVPDWQISRVIGATRIPQGSTATRSAIDGVGYLLNNLELLHLQYVTSRTALVQDLLSPLRGLWSMLPGYSPGLWATGSPILLPEDAPGQEVTTAQHEEVFRSDWLLAQGGGLLLLMLTVLLGLPRLSELWQEPPVERAAHWPGETEVRGMDASSREGSAAGRAGTET